jgi:hypothetical protein
MKPGLKEIDSKFTEHYRKLLEVQESVKKQLDLYDYNLEASEITDAIIERMNAFWHFNSHNNWGLLNRRSNPVSADFFTETCLLFIKTYFKSRHNMKFKVYSERNINTDKGRSVVKPDITIWRGEDELVAAIELKVSDGWKGKNMEGHLLERENLIRNTRNGVWFGVLAYWNFEDESSPEWGKKYFGLLNHDKGHQHTPTGLTVEKMIIEIERHIKPKE